MQTPSASYVSMGSEASSTQTLQDLQAQHIQAQHNTLMHQAHSNGAHNGQLVLHSNNQPHPPGQNQAQNQGLARQAKGDHARFFPTLSTADFDPTVPLRLETSTKPKIDLTGATLLEPSNDPKDLRSLFSATVNAKKVDENKAGGLGMGKKRERPASFDASMTQKPSKTFGELNKGYQRALSQSHPIPQKKQKVAGTKAGGVPGGIVAKEQAPKQTQKPSAGKVAPKAPLPTLEPVVGAPPVSVSAMDPAAYKELDPVGMKVIRYAYILGAISVAVANPSVSGINKGMSLESMERLMQWVPEFFSRAQEKASHASSDARSGFSPSPKIGVATATADGQHTPPNVSIPMFDGSGSVQRIPNADAIQGQMEMAMKGRSKAEPYFTPIPIPILAKPAPLPSKAPAQQGAQNGESGDEPRMDLPQQPQTATDVDQGLEDPGLSTPVKDLPATDPQTSLESDGPPAGSSPFQIEGGRAHVDQETLLEQTKINDHERLQKQLKMVETEILKAEIAKSELKSAEGSADSQASLAGAEDTEPGEKGAALQVPPAVEEVATPKPTRGKKGAASQASPVGKEETEAKPKPTPKRGKKGAVSQASPAGEEEAEAKPTPTPKRGKKGTASQASPAGEEETKAKPTPKPKRGKKGEDDDEFKPTPTPKRGTKRAAPQPSPAGEGIEPKPKRKRPYVTKKMKAEAEAAAAAAAKTTADEQNAADAAVPDPTTVDPVTTAEEQNAAVPDAVTVVPSNGTSAAGESAPDTIPAENGMSGSSPTATDDTATDQTAPLGELEVWIKSAPLTPLTGEGLEDLEALFERTAARISRPGKADNPIDLTAIDAL
ncbi:hypothetical protein IMZ48_05930 [Candidatus Bathyarchaeota archaeon]|nr:hypothetical protein [Candidatus Bathyarchaeota archaeon]